ncbi:MlaD family protein [Legionella impletisoli]|uniref:Membrane protein n=1 Tax=Legionella impletisoli TaxID=343510 RepID=A0A917JRL7_9GAMM|nr:MlaD family protein [Legionella impletisoli]GGI80448.1 membrane protein [Legionella impletisoli]
MRQDRKYTLVGIFITGAFILFIFSSFFFYETYLKQEMETYVMFFNGSLEGIDSRSSVTYRGVKIGEVSRIELTESRKKNTVEVPVYVQFFVERTTGFRQNPIRLLINQGYIADVSTPNLITGVASIELIKSEKHPTHYRYYYNDYPIFPTATIVEKHTSVDETLKVAKKAMEDIREFIKSGEMQEMVRSINDMSNSVEKLAHQLNLNVAPFMTQFTLSMQQVSKAAESTENFMDYLLRYPESLLRGRA